MKTERQQRLEMLVEKGYSLAEAPGRVRAEEAGYQGVDRELGARSGGTRTVPRV